MQIGTVVPHTPRTQAAHTCCSGAKRLPREHNAQQQRPRAGDLAPARARSEQHGGPGRRRRRRRRRGRRSGARQEPPAQLHLRPVQLAEPPVAARYCALQGLRLPHFLQSAAGQTCVSRERDRARGRHTQAGARVRRCLPARWLLTISPTRIFNLFFSLCPAVTQFEAR